MRRLILATAAFLCASAAAAQPSAAQQPSWVESATALMPQGYVAGLAWRTDADNLTGYLSAFPASANDPRAPGSAFDPGHVLVVKLERRGDALARVSATLRPRVPDDRLARAKAEGDTSTDETISWFDENNREIAARASTLPAGTVPCELHAWSIDKDPKGLNVRAEPSVKARILGTLPPPLRFKGRSEAVVQPYSWLTEFKIIGAKDGWFLIEGATPPGQKYEDKKSYPRNHPKPYPGRGWVHASKVGANYANGQTRMGGLFQAPHIDAKWTPAKDETGSPMDLERGPKRIFACSGNWALVESYDNVIGWWRALCSSQVTNCS